MIAFVIPGRLDTPTGGYVYGRRIIEGLRRSGMDVEVKALSPLFPFPDAPASRAAERTLADLPDNTRVVIDGLAAGAMPSELERQASRLRIVALVHHPLARETGLSTDAILALETSERRALTFVRHAIVTSRTTAATLARDYGVEPARIAVVEPGTDRAIRAHGSPGTRTELLCVASVTPRKGHVTLVRALARLADLDWMLTCVGSMQRDPVTPLRIYKEVAKAKLRDRVVFEDEVKDTSELEPFYGKADIFALPTEYEGYGMAVAEALAHGIPVVSTPTGGIADLVGTEAGILVPPGDVNALADALRLLMTNNVERDRLREGAWRIGNSLPTWIDAADRFAEVLARV